MKIGTIFAILHMLGKTPNVKDLFINSQKGTGIIPFILFKTLWDKLLGPVLLFNFSVWIMSLISYGAVEDKIQQFVLSFKIIFEIVFGRWDVSLYFFTEVIKY